MNRFRQPVMNVPITGPSDRLYGNWILDSTDVVTAAPSASPLFVFAE